MKMRHKGKIIAALVILGILTFTYWWGGDAPGLRGWDPASPSAASDVAITPADMPEDRGTDRTDGAADESAEVVSGMSAKEEAPAGKAPGTTGEAPLSAGEKLALAASLAGEKSSLGVEKGSEEYSEKQGMVLNKSTGKDKYLTDPVPEGKPVPVEPQNVVPGETARICTLSVRCDTILKNIRWLNPEKVELVPEDGVIFPATKVTFYEGESVFNVLQREMKKAKIHMEFVNTPIYNSAYIEGINNLYEFDCGELSGWMYRVNGWFPNYGASRYQLKDGDVVEWVYTCDLGIDVGGYYATGGE